MNKTVGLQLVSYSLLLAGLSFLTHHLSPGLARPTLIAGLVGGSLCLGWGLWVVAGGRGKALPILTLIPINFVMLSQAVMTWTARSQDVPGQRLAAATMTVLFALSMAMVARITHAGVTFDGPPASPGKDGGAKSQPSRQPPPESALKKRTL